MGTRAGYFRDVIFTTGDIPALLQWFNSNGWSGWDTEQNSFRSGVVGASWARSGPQGIAYLRMPQALWDELLSLNPPTDKVTVYAQADPYADVSDIGDDPDAVLQRRSVFHKIKSDSAKVTRIRQFWPRERPVYDQDGDQVGIREVGLMFASFGDNWPDPKGDGEA